MPVHHIHHPPGVGCLLHRHREEYRLEETGPRTSAAGIITRAEHSGTHIDAIIDAICRQTDDLCLLGGVPASEVQTFGGFTKLGVEDTADLCRGSAAGRSFLQRSRVLGAGLRDYSQRDLLRKV